jgi:uncharacterized protein YndB with AHSA1/START domain
MMNRGRILLVALALAGPAQAAEPSWRDYPSVENSSYVEPSGDRSIQLSTIVSATPHQAFQAFTTDAGFSAWAVKMAKIDLRVGGMIEASYDGAAKVGDPDNIKNQILAYVPDRLLVIRNVQAPRSLPGREAFARTVTMVSFEPAAGGTRVTVTNAGYGSDPDSARVYKHFEWGNAYTLDALRQYFLKPERR